MTHSNFPEDLGSNPKGYDFTPPQGQNSFPPYGEAKPVQGPEGRPQAWQAPVDAWGRPVASGTFPEGQNTYQAPPPAQPLPYSPGSEIYGSPQWTPQRKNHPKTNTALALALTGFFIPFVGFLAFFYTKRIRKENTERGYNPQDGTLLAAWIISLIDLISNVLGVLWLFVIFMALLASTSSTTPQVISFLAP